MPISWETLARFKSDVFIETGTLHGDGVLAAVKAGYKRIYSIELASTLFNATKKKLGGIPNVTLLLGSSVPMLRRLLPNIKQRATFFLDAHWCEESNDTDPRPARDPNLPEFPVVEELTAIKEYSLRNDNTILVDDLRAIPSLTTHMAMKVLKSINPLYVVQLVDSPIASIRHHRLYKPTKAALGVIWDRVSTGGVVIFDEYGIRDWPGETLAVDELLPGERLQSFEWTNSPAAYIVK